MWFYIRCFEKKSRYLKLLWYNLDTMTRAVCLYNISRAQGIQINKQQHVEKKKIRTKISKVAHTILLRIWDVFTVADNAEAYHDRGAAARANEGPPYLGCSHYTWDNTGNGDIWWQGNYLDPSQWHTAPSPETRDILHYREVFSLPF